MLYDPSGVGGLHMMYVVPRGDRLGDYGLPADPQVPGTFFSALSVLRKLGSISVWGGLLASAIFYLRMGRRRPPPEDEAVAEAERLGHQAHRSRSERLRSTTAGTGGKRAGRRRRSRRSHRRTSDERRAGSGGATRQRRSGASAEVRALHLRRAAGPLGGGPHVHRPDAVGLRPRLPPGVLPVGSVRRRADDAVPASRGSAWRSRSGSCGCWCRGPGHAPRRRRPGVGAPAEDLRRQRPRRARRRPLQRRAEGLLLVLGHLRAGAARHRPPAVVPLAARAAADGRTSPGSCTTPPSCSWSAASSSTCTCRP